jgi:hypothetical protein
MRPLSLENDDEAYAKLSTYGYTKFIFNVKSRFFFILMPTFSLDKLPRKGRQFDKEKGWRIAPPTT